MKFHTVSGKAKQQGSWMHKAGNILNKLPKILRPRAKHRIHDIWIAKSNED